MTIALRNRPLMTTAPATGWFGWVKRINWAWWLQRLPMALLAVPSAYGVGGFGAEHLPLWAAVIQGLAFECCYLGAIALADQQDEGDAWTTGLWWGVNVGAVLSSVTCNLLWVSANRFTNIGPESFAHAAPMPVLGFLYGLLLHRTSSRSAQRAFEASERQRQRDEADAEEQQSREHEAALRAQFTCPDCQASFVSEPALRGHKGRCAARKVPVANIPRS